MSDLITFKKELEGLINRHSMENGSNTPDMLLAEYLTECLSVWNRIIKARDKWWNHKTIDTEGKNLD